MATYKQINYIKTLLRQVSRKTKEEFEESEELLLNKDTPSSVVRHWIDRLEKEIGYKTG